jgi:cyclase
VSQIAEAIGTQSMVVVLDVRKKSFPGGYEIFMLNGQKATGLSLPGFVEMLNNAGVGEIVINSIDRDGTMNGYDTSLVEMVRELTDVPLTVLGGAGSVDDIRGLISKYKIIGAAAGSLFVFKGKYRAVLINYPNISMKTELQQV